MNSPLRFLTWTLRENMDELPDRKRWGISST